MACLTFDLHAEAYTYEEYSAESETVPDMMTTYKTHGVVVTIKERIFSAMIWSRCFTPCQDKTRKELISMGLPAGEDGQGRSGQRNGLTVPDGDAQDFSTDDGKTRLRHLPRRGVAS